VCTLSYKTQIYLVLLLLLLYYVVIPLIRYCGKRIATSLDPMRFNLQHVMIVGGSDGLGKALVKEVFLKGALVTIVGRDENKMMEIRKELDTNEQGQPLIRYFNEDIMNMESFEVEKLLRKAEKYFGTIEMFIFCAARSEPVMFLSSDLNKFKNHMDLNFFCAVKFLIPISKRMALRKT